MDGRAMGPVLHGCATTTEAARRAVHARRARVRALAPQDGLSMASAQRGGPAIPAAGLDPERRAGAADPDETPALQAHSVLRYGEWRAVIAAYVAGRTGQQPHDLLPRTVGHVSLALALTAYETWLADESVSLLRLLDDAMNGLRTYLAD